MTIALIDADIVAYRSAASCEPSKARDWVEPVEVAIMRVDALMERIQQETAATAYRAFLTGSDNYRTQYNPSYKENRKNVPRPRWLQDVRQHLVVQYGATVEDGQEADDALGIAQCASDAGTTVIASIDKDLLCVPGKHHNFVTGTFYEQSDLGALHHFYYQMLMGDKADNIFGFDGLARQKVPQKFEGIFNELASYDRECDMFSLVQSLYNNDERLLMNGRCLWIRQREDEIWAFPA
jgi:5'-3' exonuclease